MARKQRPNIQGHNPEYSTNFTSSRESTSSFTAGAEKASPPPNLEPAKAAGPTTPAPDTVGTEADKPSTADQTPETPTPAKSETVKVDPLPKTEPIEGKKPAPKPKGKRETRLSGAVKVDQAKKLDALERQGIAARDVIVLAGRRATARFEPTPKFVEKPEADRLPMLEGYHSTKRLPASILDDLREKHDPLRLRSDGAMVRGQFEPLFWACLDEVIEELQQKKG